MYYKRPYEFDNREAFIMPKHLKSKISDAKKAARERLNAQKKMLRNPSKDLINLQKELIHLTHNKTIVWGDQIPAESPSTDDDSNLR